jgi:Asp-tRNA(Asn)/Glu-tRNA(Gln) amidotransferase A subunit family amidase
MPFAPTPPFSFLRLLAVGLISAFAIAARATEFNLSTATVADIQAAFAKNALTSEKLVSLYLARIAAYDQQGPKLNTIITLNPRALDEARALDAERRSTGPRSPLHGTVVVVKDVFDTKDLPTSGGFAPMATSQPSRDSFVIDRLRRSGVIILAKLNQSDWYGVGQNGGGTLKARVISPYNPRKYGGGSSTGTGAAMAAWFASFGLGSDTTGSVINPTTLNSLVGLAATHGLVSRTGMMWSSPRQEMGGPMTRSVYDVAAVLDAIAGYDAADLSTEASVGRVPDRPYTSFVNPRGLVGARVGVLREMVRSGPDHAEGVALFNQAVADFKTAGALVVDPVLTGLDLAAMQADADAADVERAAAIDKYLAGLPATAPIRSVAEMIAKGGALVKPAIIETAKLSALERNTRLTAIYRQQDALRTALLGLMEKYQLDGLILPFRTLTPWDIDHMPRNTWQNPEVRNHLASSTDLPTIIVPGGFWPSDGMPFGVQFLGRPFSEPTLLTLASGYEATTKHRRAPASTPALPGESFAY